MSTAPAEGRGGAGNPLAQLKSKKGLRKAPETSVVKDMGADVSAAEDAPEASAASSFVPVLEEVPSLPAEPVLAPTVVAAVQPVPVVQEPEMPVEVPAPAQRASEAATVEKKKMGFWVSQDIVDRIRNAYGPTSRLEGHRSLSDLAARALETEAARLEEKYNDGEPFPPDEIGIPRGRPLR